MKDNKEGNHGTESLTHTALESVLSKTGIPNGMQKKTLLITWWKTITSEHS